MTSDTSAQTAGQAFDKTVDVLIVGSGVAA